MTKLQYEIVHEVPTVQDYLRLRKESGLSEKSIEAAERGLKNSLFAVSIYDGETLIGMGRVIGDNGCFYQIVDIAVAPHYQGQGLGKRIMKEIMDYLENKAPKSAYVSLIADAPANKLYEKFGFTYTYPKSHGMYKKY
ncbi:ribosomal protein S18 acetylase RimI-like enzyme [Anoxybacillus calidus]|jgi:ribosomal protein S18 acetylase RimI-like enzyme|uniref:Ribosomal protein S18 acetylase RimI-like enzyme n=1 Tax=[Anoxybacillus] calidus TaxID=575178 RepID=A0A7V9Z1K8_9BACL|nr:GNAT family N-acetyltransferase [Anoxybacillus calidus]MBA2872414.1 ribosomal protein S18 acetylase RimI-like enzyme [Anoxybacillus calidus]